MGIEMSSLAQNILNNLDSQPKPGGFLKAFDPLTGEYIPIAIGDSGVVPVDWQDEITRAAITNHYKFGINGGTEKHNYNASFSFQDRQGIIKTTNLQRATAIFNMSQNFNKKFKTGFMMNIGFSNRAGIVSASSINGTAGAFGQTNYCATKAGISGFTRALCKEVGKYGITANAVAPGFIKSVMTDSMPEEVIKAGISMIPVGRIGTPEDMGQAYLFLASKEAGFINGITLHANGGAMPL